MGTDIINLSYRFGLPGGRVEEINLDLDAETIELRASFLPQPAQQAPWTDLKCHQCPGCALSADTNRSCPVAASLVGVVRAFDDILSFEEVDLEVQMADRRLSQRTTAQKATRSAIGVLIATSGCPDTAFLRPMARFHLPLSSEEETIYRAVSMYLLAQYFNARDGGDFDIHLEGLKARYDRLDIINQCLVKRLRSATVADSSINAMIGLDAMAKAIPFVVEDSVEELRYLFRPYT